MIESEDIIENRLKLTSQTWKEKVENYEFIISAMKNKYSIKYFDSNSEVLISIINESNALALEKALELILFYLSISEVGKRNLKSHLNAFVEKCFKSSRQQTRDFGIDIMIMQCSNCLSDVIECLTMFMADNRPIIVNCVIEALILIIKKYKIASIQKLVNSFPKLFESRDHQTRTLIKKLTVNIGHIYGKTIINSLLKELKPIHVNDINTDLNNIVQTDNIMATLVCENVETVVENVQFFDILKVLDEDFYEHLDGTKVERKEALENLYLKISDKRLSNGNYRELIKKLCFIVNKDSQVTSVILAIKILTEIAKSLGKNFTNLSLLVIETCLEKFKEKKPVIITLVRQCIDASFATTSLEPCMAAILEALDNKNPSVRSETLAFLLRLCVNGRSKPVLNKHSKSLMPLLRKLCDDGVVEVRDQTFQLIGQIWSNNNGKMIENSLEGLDSVKMLRIKSFIGKEVPSANEVPKEPVVIEKKIAKIAPKPIETPTIICEVPKKKLEQLNMQHKEIWLSASDFDDKCSAIFGSNNFTNLNSPSWQNRVNVLEHVTGYVDKKVLDPLESQIVVRFLLMKPGLKDSNLMVVRKKCEIIQTIFHDHKVSGMIAESCVSDVVEKLGDAKIGSLFKSLLPMLFKNISDLSAVTVKALRATIDSKSVRCNIELLKWLSDYLYHHEHRSLCPRDLVPPIRQLLSSTNSDVRRDTITLIGVIYKMSGRTIIDALDREKPAIVDMIEKEVTKMNVIKKEEQNNEKLKLQTKITLIEQTCEQVVSIKSEYCSTLNIQDTPVSQTSNVSECETGTDLKDDARSFFFDMCNKLKSHIDQHGAPAMELELKEMFASIMVMGEKWHTSVNVLKSVFKKGSEASVTIATQTEADDLVPIPTVIQTPVNHMITRRRHKKTTQEQFDNNENKENTFPNRISDYNLAHRNNTNDKKYVNDMITETIKEKKPIINTILNQLQSSMQPLIIYDSLVQLDEYLRCKTSARENISPIISAIISRLSVIARANDENSIPELEKIVSLLSRIYSWSECVSRISDQQTMDLVNCQCTIIQMYRSINGPLEKDLSRSLNTLTMKIIESTDLSRILYSLFILMDRCFENSSYKSNFINMVVKILWDRTKIINATVMLSDEYMVEIMKLINEQFNKYLNNSDIVNSMAFKSVKTFVNKVTTVRGLDLLRYLPQDDNHNLTEYIHYCTKRKV